MTFRLAPYSYGSDPNDWPTINEWLSEADVPFLPDASWMDQSDSIRSLAGYDHGRGFAVIKWHWNIMSNKQRAVLKAICPGLSARVWIESLTNDEDLCTGEELWFQGSGIMHWTDGEEDQQSDDTIGVDLDFTHLAELP